MRQQKTILCNINGTVAKHAEIDVLAAKIQNLQSQIETLAEHRNKLTQATITTPPKWFVEKDWTLYFIYSNMAVDKVTFTFDPSISAIIPHITRFFPLNTHTSVKQHPIYINQFFTKNNFKQQIKKRYLNRSYRTLTSKQNAKLFLANKLLDTTNII